MMGGSLPALAGAPGGEGSSGDDIEEDRMDLHAMGRAGLTGVPGKVGRRAARAVSKRSGLDEEQVAAIIGGLLLAFWLYRTTKTFMAIIKAGQGEREPDLAVEGD
jgi:hypothetical protein